MAALCWMYGFGLVLAILTLPLILAAGARTQPALWAAPRTLGLMMATLLHGQTGLLGLQAWSLPALAVVGALVLILAVLWSGPARTRSTRLPATMHWPTLLAPEAVFLAAFLLAAWLVAHDAVLIGTERMMDFAIYQSVGQAIELPPVDPWFAGASLNYYWFGHHLAAMLSVPLRLPTEVGYNLALAYTFGLCAQLCFGVALRLGGGYRPALLACVLVMLAGNLHPLWHMLTGQGLAAFNYLAASRVLAHAITEFPLLSLLVGDLHAHYQALALLLMFILWLPPRAERTTAATAVGILLGNLALVATALANPWNLAAMLLIFLAVRWHKLTDWPWWSLLPALALLPWLWPVQGQGVSPAWLDAGRRSEMGPFLLMWGMPILLCAGLLDWRDRCQAALRRPGYWGLLVVLWLVLGPAAALCLGVALALFLGHARANALWAVLAATGLVLVAIPEVVYLRDPYPPPFERMNTVFKFSYAAWPLIMLGAARGALCWLSAGAPNAMGAWRAGLVLMLSTLFVYPAFAITQRLDRHADRPYWDGFAGLRAEHAADMHLIAWLRAMRTPGEVCLEAPGDAYTWSGRIGALSGCPVPLGWESHEVVWRGGSGNRRAEVDALYAGDDPAQRRMLLDRYRIRWVVVGSVERARYRAEELAVWSGHYPVAYRYGDGVIYRIGP